MIQSACSLLLVSLLSAGMLFAQDNGEAKSTLFANEILQTEIAFQRDLKEKGAAYAFHKYAAESAVIKRERDSLITGSNAIFHYYSQPAYKNGWAEWVPDFIDVAADGTLGYTYGKYTWIIKDDKGKQQTFKGIFHTVWKRQPDGSWKYVWD